MVESKKYGDRYMRRSLLPHGSIKEIAKAAGLRPITVTQQLLGYRKLQPIIKALADSIADKTESIITQGTSE